MSYQSLCRVGIGPRLEHESSNRERDAYRMASESTRVIYAAIAANLAIAVTKFTAAAFTNSSAMISEGIHSLVDTGNGGLMLLGVRRSAKPADAKHPFGYGKELYFWTLPLSSLQSAAGFLLMKVCSTFFILPR